MNLPDSPDTISTEYLEPLLRAYTGNAGSLVTGFKAERLSRGTSGAGLYVLSVDVASGDAPHRFILKFNGGRKEVLFYRDLAGRVAVDTPRVLDARLPDESSSWLIMEEIKGIKDGLAWDVADYEAVVTGMARFHAGYWGQTSLLDDCPWLWRPDEKALEELVAARRSDAEAILAAGLPEAFPQVFGAERLAKVMRALEQPDKLFGPLLAAGATLVHGDYWFYNVQVTGSGRRVLVDWQGPQVWSGLWELAYFLNLLHVTESGAYREQLPIEEDAMVSLYASALAEAGIALPKNVFDRALLSARIWHPIQHWVRQIGRAAAHGLITADTVQKSFPGAERFLADTFARWDEDVRTLNI